MINKPTNASPTGETRWHYLGPDNEMYGPYSSKDMLFWLQSGYFTETLQLRTENETQYHSLGEWNSLLGTSTKTGHFLHVFQILSTNERVEASFRKAETEEEYEQNVEAIVHWACTMYDVENVRMFFIHAVEAVLMHPFNMSIFSMEAIVNSIQQIRPPQPPMMVMPPGIAPPFPPPQLRYPHFMPMPPIPMHHGGPNGGQTLQQLHSQPPSEPIDGSLSHTPDSENELRGLEISHKSKNNRQNHTNAWFAELGLTQRAPTTFQGPQMANVSTETDVKSTKDSSCQTDTIRINQKQASRILSELLGQPVLIH